MRNQDFVERGKPKVNSFCTKIVLFRLRAKQIIEIRAYYRRWPKGGAPSHWVIFDILQQKIAILTPF